MIFWMSSEIETKSLLSFRTSDIVLFIKYCSKPPGILFYPTASSVLIILLLPQMPWRNTSTYFVCILNIKFLCAIQNNFPCEWFSFDGSDSSLKNLTRALCCYFHVDIGSYDMVGRRLAFCRYFQQSYLLQVLFNPEVLFNYNHKSNTTATVCMGVMQTR